jgi:tetratricopeptide (TPR) repeat protein
MKKRTLLLALIIGLAPVWLSANDRVLLVARSYVGREPISGLQFGCQGVVSKPTNLGGATEVDLPTGYSTGRQIKIDLIATRKAKGESWFLVNDLVNIPTASESAALMLMRGSEMRQIGAEVRKRSTDLIQRPGEATAEQQRRALAAAAARRGLTFEQLQMAIDSFAKTPDAKDQGIALYLQGKYSQAEKILTDVAAKKELDLIDTLRYVGASQLAQGEYREAADSLRKALSLHPDDADLLNSLGGALYLLDDWSGAEPAMRRALAIDEATFGLEHPKVARDLNDLALLLQATNRRADAEPLFRYALAINERSLGPGDAEVARNLNNLALLLSETSRVADAEPLLRRALAINEKILGPEHPEVATTLNNLALVIQDSERNAEAELLLRRALTIYEKRYGPEHPDVATALTNLAGRLTVMNRPADAEPLLRRSLAIDEKILGPEHHRVATALANLGRALQATNRLGEAEPLLRRALAINEKSYGPEHPDVAVCLGYLAYLLEITNRAAEAEPLRRRALAIDEKSYGPESPEVTFDLNGLAGLLQATNRLGEAEPLQRRTLAILADFSRRSGHPHPNLEMARQKYAALLRKMGRSQPEVDAAIETVIGPPK